jgi:hypothetical protein
VISDDERLAAEARMQAEGRSRPRAVEARFDARRSRIVVTLDNGLELAFPARQAEGLELATRAELAEIEISPSGDGLHWPAIDADLYIPSLLRGAFGSKTWMARQLGAAGGKARSRSKVDASRRNGRKGGRPPKIAGA